MSFVAEVSLVTFDQLVLITYLDDFGYVPPLSELSARMPWPIERIERVLKELVEDGHLHPREAVPQPPVPT